MAKPFTSKLKSMIDIQHSFSRFSVNQDIIKDSLRSALSKGADFAELFFQDSSNQHVSLEDHKVSKATTRVDYGVGVRSVKGDQVGYAYTEDMHPSKIKEASLLAATIADCTVSHAPVDLTQNSIPSFYSNSVDVKNIELSKKVELLNDIDQAVFQMDKRIVKAQLSVQVQQDHILIANSEGVLVADFQPMILLLGSVVAEENGKREQNRHNLSLRAGFEALDAATIKGFVHDLVTGVTDLFQAIRPKGGEMEVVLGAGGSGILLHEAIGHGLEADFNRKKLSIFSNKMGKPIAAPHVNIVDDGTMVRSRGAINVDDEGIEGQKTTLVQDGVLVNYIHDRISAKYYGVEPTGNGRRQSFRHEPMPRMRNTYMTNGPHTKQEIIESVQYGIYADSFSNGQVNIGAGDFTFYVKSGFLIENGKLTQPIKDINIIGNGPEVLANISMVANDMEISEGGWTCGKRGQSVPVSIGIPSVKAGKLTVGGS